MHVFRISFHFRLHWFLFFVKIFLEIGHVAQSQEIDQAQQKGDFVTAKRDGYSNQAGVPDARGRCGAAHGAFIF